MAFVIYGPVTLEPYSKPHLTFADQLELLKARGMAVADEPLALKHLERIGYYRLKAYWYSLRDAVIEYDENGEPRTSLLETFKAGVEFRHGVDLYVFDKKLRLLILDALERIEVALRVDVAYELGKRGATAHLEYANLNQRHALELTKSGLSRMEEWLDKVASAETRSRADWLTDFKRNYSSPLPVWMAVELWDFGNLSHLIALLHITDQQRIAKKYGLPNPTFLVSWVRALVYLRNACSHHDRIWNLPLVIQPKIPLDKDVPRVAHIGRHDLSKKRIYAIIAIAQHFLDQVNPTSTWKTRLKELWGDFPVVPGVVPQQAGFLQNWQSYPLWQ